jgi:cell division septum initiation protein DivIVA
MGNRVSELLEMLYSMINEAWGIPLGAEKCVIERDKALDLLDEIKSQFPNELAEAKRLVDSRAEFINSAKREADGIRKTAEERARQLIDEQEVIRAAKAKSHEMLAAAEASANELRRVANEYVDDAMKRTEEALGAALEEMRQNRARFRSAAGSAARNAPNRSGREFDTGRIDIGLDEK